MIDSQECIRKAVAWSDGLVTGQRPSDYQYVQLRIRGDYPLKVLGNTWEGSVLRLHVDETLGVVLMASPFEVGQAPLMELIRGTGFMRTDPEPLVPTSSVELPVAKQH